MALISVIVLGGVLTTWVASFSGRIWLNRMSNIRRELRTESQKLAQACAAQALVNFALDSDYRGNEEINWPGGSCRIEQLTANEEVVTIISSAQTEKQRTVLESTANISDLIINPQKEIH